MKKYTVILLAIVTLLAKTQAFGGIYFSKPMQPFACKALAADAFNYEYKWLFGNDFAQLASETLDFVYLSYENIIHSNSKKRGMSPDFLASLKAEDLELASDRIVYFIDQTEGRQPRTTGAMRVFSGFGQIVENPRHWSREYDGAPSSRPAKQVRVDWHRHFEYDPVKLPLERKFPNFNMELSANKIEFGRLFTTEGSDRLNRAAKLIYEALLFYAPQLEVGRSERLKKIKPPYPYAHPEYEGTFETLHGARDDLMIYVHADKVTTRLYRRFGMKIKYSPDELGSTNNYVLEISAKSLAKNLIEFIGSKADSTKSR